MLDKASVYYSDILWYKWSTSHKFLEIRNKFIEKVFKKFDNRKNKNKLLEDFKSMEIKNIGDQKEFLILFIILNLTRNS
jgi:hypothetical protein